MPYSLHSPAFLRITFLCWAMSLCAGQIEKARADELRIGETRFFIDKIENLDQGSVRFSIAQQSKIVPKSELESEVLKVFFSDSILLSSFSTDQLQKLCRYLLNAGRQDDAAIVLSGLIAHAEKEDSRLNDIMHKLESIPGIYQIFRSALLLGLPAGDQAESAAANPAVQNLILKIGLLDATWVRRNFLKLISQNAPEFETRIQQLFEQAIQNEDFMLSEQITKLSAALFGRQNSTYRKFTDYSQRFRDIVDARRTRNTERLYPILRFAREDAEFRRLFAGLLLEAFHARARQQLSNQHPEAALATLAELEADFRSAETYELVSQSLSQLNPQVDLATNRAVSSLIFDVAKKDPQVREVLTQFLTQQVEIHAHHFHFRKAEDDLQGLLEIRADPSAANDGLRLMIAQRYVEVGQLVEATRLIESIQTGLGLWSRVHLLWSGYYVSRATLFALISVPLLLLLLLYIRTRARLVRQLRAQAPAANRRASLQEQGQDRSGGFSYNIVKQGLSPRMYEYVGLLRTFELEAEADMKTIKAAYRAAVKTVHPDLNPNVSDTQKEKFIQYTTAYEKIIELRRSLGFGVD